MASGLPLKNYSDGKKIEKTQKFVGFSGQIRDFPSG
jgi:hypothetical protein